MFVARSHIGFLVCAVRSRACRQSGACERSHFGRIVFANTVSISARMLEFTMNRVATARPRARGRWALIAAGIFGLLGSFVVIEPAQAGYYEGYNPCSYRCGYPAYRYYPAYRHHCYSCGTHLIYELRFVEREYVERRYGYGGYRRHYYGYPYYRRHYGYYPYGGYRRPWGYGYGYGSGGIGRRWPVPYAGGYRPYAEGYRPDAEGYEEPPRPPAPILDEGEY
jgi:hypothetical protein